MRRLREALLRATTFLRGLAGRSGDDEARAELESHLEMDVAENVRRGMAPDEARRRALIAAGGLTVAAESVREARGLPWAESLLTDVRYAMRSLRGQPGYTGAVVGTLALGIGAAAAMFTILNAVILQPLPYPEADRILSLSIATNPTGTGGVAPASPQKGSDAGVVDDRNYAEWARAARTLEAIAVYSGGSSVIQTADGPREVRLMPATASYFKVLGVNPMMGRTYTEEEVDERAPVLLVSEQLWRTQFGADSAILSRSIRLDGEPATVIGVMPASFATARGAQIWKPYQARPATGNSTFWFSVLARRRAAVSIEGVRAELETLSRGIDSQRREGKGMTPVVMTLHERRYGSTRTPLFLLFAAVGVLLLITCANLANLALARTTKRRREFSLRVALGARRWRLVRHVLLENLLLSLAGGALGLAIAAASVGYFARISPSAVGNVEGIAVNGTVAAFTLAVAVLTSILFGLVPAVTAGRTSLTPSLAAGSARAAGSRGQGILRRSLVVVELATALVLVIGAGLVARTFWTVTSIDPGFDPANVVTARLQLPWNAYTDTTGRRFMEAALERVRAQPGVESAALVDALPLTGARMSATFFSREGVASPRFDVVGATPGFFETMGTRVLEGREFTSDDGDGRPRVAVVTSALARAIYPDRNAIGEPFGVGEDKATIVGIVDDVRQRQLEGAAPLVVFMPLDQFGYWHYLSLAIRTSGNAAPLTRSVTRIVQELDPALPPPPFRTMHEIVAEQVAPRKFVLVLLGLFAGLAGLLAAIGLYGVLAYLVTERTREIGIRVALGADSGMVMRYMLGQGAALTIGGLALGVGGGLLAVRLLQSMVYEMSVYDPRTFVAGALVLGGVAMLASYIPALRASRVDPVIALRAE